MFYVLIYISAIVAANLSIAEFGPWVSPINSFVLIGLDLTLRDKLHDKWRNSMLWTRMLGLIASAGAISMAINTASGMIAIASMVAFCAAALVDAAVYQATIAKPFMIRANASNIAGSLADSLIFPTIAFGAILPGIVAMQFGAKVLGGLLWAAFIARAAITKAEGGAA